ncbi:porin OmpF [Citrobacter freundii]|uniref:Porin OmpF n=1 Tax=Citrobacter freundii TaxID=546 RepID=A0AAE7KY82_CITFR|nr:porin OmpF [Citrobacter freundii]QLO13418.1 porin OmpF [Citrobacter freundii]QLO43440.1 porin OmpF [Citrobacter freundii]QLV41604.1 porin OmpF [Citrobacter freundii]QLW75396.1 porin OmpF [Citrobacter freundii]QLY61640.1 porin OmpF [Citrobacter freundii]
MMKRNILAVVIPALLVAGAANAAEVYNKDGNKLDLYGKTVGLHYFSDNAGNDGDQTYARLGFKGETQINADLTGYGQWEYNFAGNNSEGGSDAQNGNKTRLAFAGLKYGDAGSFDYGRNYGIVYDALGYTDMLPEFGGDTAYSDNFFVGRVGGVATYRNSNFFGLVDGLNFGVQYLGKNERDGNTSRSNGDGVGGSVSYEMDGFGIVGAYGAADRTNAQENTFYANGGKKAEQWATGLKYDANNIYLATNYGETRNATRFTNGINNVSGFANKTQDFFVVAQYQFDFGLRPSISYNKSKAKDVEGIGNEDLVNYIEVGATYYFNKNMSTYVDYQINQIDSDNKLGVNSDDTVALGIVYQF